MPKIPKVTESPLPLVAGVNEFNHENQSSYPVVTGGFTREILLPYCDFGVVPS